MGFLLLFLGMAAILFYLSVKRMRENRIPVIILGVLCIIFGLMGYLLQEEILTGDFWQMVALFVYTYSVAGFFAVGIYMKASKVAKAGKQIQGTLNSKKKVRGGMFPLYQLSFHYEYEGKEYYRLSNDTVGRMAVKKVEENRTYPIYISEKNPQFVIYKRHLSKGTWVMIVFFVLLVCLPIGVCLKLI